MSAVSELEPRLAILQCWAAGAAPTAEEYESLLAFELSQSDAVAFGLTAVNGREQLAVRSQHFQNLCADILELCGNQFGLHDTDSLLLTLWRFWLPLALELVAEREQLGRPVVQGILGGQGTGKTTLATVLSYILEALGDRSVNFSLDDLYKSYVERQRLQQTDPRLRWRGPPGTHDVAIGIELLDNLRQAHRRKPAIMPRFNKSACGGSGDKAQPEIVDSVDVVLFEGWFVGVRPVMDERVFDQAPDPIVSDADRAFARDCNERLLEYVPLWHRLDRLAVLQLCDYRLSKPWRLQAEHWAIAQGRSGMSDAELDAFVEYFWKALHPELFITPLTQNSLLTNLVVEIQTDRRLGRIYKPK
ncbi:MAG: glycerate kinase [Spirulinaceae cyanobacterium SM2_1_0]|nr:glycerate kinase [Spirulinaceae cyanobacterium SM2_1_0]